MKIYMQKEYEEKSNFMIYIMKEFFSIFKTNDSISLVEFIHAIMFIILGIVSIVTILLAGSWSYVFFPFAVYFAYVGMCLLIHLKWAVGLTIGTLGIFFMISCISSFLLFVFKIVIRICLNPSIDYILNNLVHFFKFTIISMLVYSFGHICFIGIKHLKKVKNANW